MQEEGDCEDDVEMPVGHEVKQTDEQDDLYTLCTAAQASSENFMSTQTGSKLPQSGDGSVEVNGQGAEGGEAGFELESELIDCEDGVDEERASDVEEDNGAGEDGV